jgi:hypothetical protein
MIQFRTQTAEYWQEELVIDDQDLDWSLMTKTLNISIV